MGEGAGRATRRRLTINQAADQLGVTVDAVRGRIKRDTIAHVREGGRVYVLLAADESRPGHDQAADQPDDRTDALIAELQDRVRSLEDANRENRRIIAALTSRIPQLEAPQEASESRETVEEAPERSSAPQPHAARSQTLQGGAPGGMPSEDGGAEAPDAFKGLSEWGYVLGVLLTGASGFLMQLGFGISVLEQFGPALPDSALILYLTAWLPPLLVPIIFGYQVGRYPRGSNFWRHVGVTAVLIAAASFLPWSLLVIPQDATRLLTANEISIIVGEATQMWIPVGFAFLSSTLLGNAKRQRVAERGVGPTPVTGFASNQWSPLTLTLIGATGNIIAAVINGVFAFSAGT